MRNTICRAAPIAVGLVLALLPALATAVGPTVYQECWKVSGQSQAPAAGCYPTPESGAQDLPTIVGVLRWTDRCWSYTFTPDGNWGFQLPFDRARGYGAVHVFGTTRIVNTCTSYVAEQAGYRVGFVERYCGVAGNTTDRWVPELSVCAPVINRFSILETKGCGFGKPIFPLTGTKRNVVNIGNQFGATFPFDMAYDTVSKLPANDAGAKWAALPLASFGELWSSSLHRRIVLEQGGSVTSAKAHRGLGRWIAFVRNAAGAFVSAANVTDRLTRLGDGGWQYVDVSSSAIERYDTTGKIVAINVADGDRLDFFYSGPGLLAEVRNRVGKSYLLTYESPTDPAQPPRISAVTDAAGGITRFHYDLAGNLERIVWPDLTSRAFLYESAPLPWAMTGVVDETGSRAANYGYDASGRAVLTEGAGGTERFSVEWGLPPAIEISDTYDPVARVIWRDHYFVVPEGTFVMQPNGERLALGVTSVLGGPELTSRSQPAGSGCAASVRTMARDSNGNVASQDDFNGIRTCHAHDPGRNLETGRVEGLAGATSCAAVVVAGAPLPVGATKVSTEWHPDWRKPTRTAEPRKVTTVIYNGQPDPFNGNAIASCAPANALLPDGKPIAVLCRQVEQATTDEDGAAGFSAALQAGVALRAQSWTYNVSGQVLSHDGPRTDVNDITTFTYYTDTTPDHTAGDLRSATNALGQTTQFTKYDKHGQVLETVGANGATTINTYDSRQRLVSSTVTGRTTAYIYSAAGQLVRTTLADGTYTGFEYDAAQRLVAVHDSLGNRIEYTLDSAGNRLAETTKDQAGVLRRALARSYDALGRLQQLSGRE